MAQFRRRRHDARPRLSVLMVAPLVGLFTVMAVPWLTTQAYVAQDARIVPFEIAAPDDSVLGDGRGGYAEAPARHVGSAPASSVLGEVGP